MRTPQVLATIAIAGSVAAFALLNSSEATSHKTFLATPISDSEREFINFIANFKRNYGTKEEYEYRLSIFAKNLEHIRAHDPVATGYTQVVGKFADYTTEEFNKMKGALPFEQSHDVNGVNAFPMHPFDETAPVPNGVDWRGRAVTPVKDQGQCGSCWSFSTTGAVEGARYVKYGVLQSFSEEQLVDCSKRNYGCGGGWPYLAMNYVASGNPLEFETDYPYTARDGSCRYNSGLGHGALSGAGYAFVAANNADAMSQAVAQQPVSVLLEADQYSFQHYGGGILAQSACGTTLDHAVLLVGYADNYWIVKNSWGPNWGDGGYIYLQRIPGDRSAGTCGVQSQPVLATA